MKSWVFWLIVFFVIVILSIIITLIVIFVDPSSPSYQIYTNTLMSSLNSNIEPIIPNNIEQDCTTICNENENCVGFNYNKKLKKMRKQN